MDRICLQIHLDRYTMKFMSVSTLGLMHSGLGVDAKHQASRRNTMTPSERKDRRQRANPLGRHITHVVGLVLIAVLARAQTAGAERPQVKASADSKVTIADDAGKKKSRRARRILRASADDLESAEGRRKRSSRNGRGRRANRDNKRSKPAQNATIRLHLSGSFESDLGNDRVVRGEGSTTLELDRAATEILRTALGARLNETAPVVRDLLKGIAALPATLESTSEILRSLADPETQDNLRQVEQLLPF
jgi:hypothetical protein